MGPIDEQKCLVFYRVLSVEYECDSALSVLLLVSILVITMVKMLWTYKVHFYHNIQCQRKYLFQSVTRSCDN